MEPQKIKNEREIRYGSLQVREIENEQEPSGQFYELDGTPIVFNQKTRLGRDMWSDKDIYEIIEPTALDSADLTDVVFNVNHGEGNHAVARTRNSTLQLSKETDGLHCRVLLDKDNPRCVQVYKDVKSGLLDKMSFAFTIKEESFDESEHCYHVRAIDKVYDVSAVEFPAYDTTSISARRASEAVAERERAVALALEAKREALLKQINRNL